MRIGGRGRLNCRTQTGQGPVQRVLVAGDAVERVQRQTVGTRDRRQPPGRGPGRHRLLQEHERFGQVVPDTECLVPFGEGGGQIAEQAGMFGVSRRDQAQCLALAVDVLVQVAEVAVAGVAGVQGPAQVAQPQHPLMGGTTTAYCRPACGDRVVQFVVGTGQPTAGGAGDAQVVGVEPDIGVVVAEQVEGLTEPTDRRVQIGTPATLLVPQEQQNPEVADTPAPAPGRPALDPDGRLPVRDRLVQQPGFVTPLKLTTQDVGKRVECVGPPLLVVPGQGHRPPRRPLGLLRHAQLRVLVGPFAQHGGGDLPDVGTACGRGVVGGVGPVRGRTAGCYGGAGRRPSSHRLGVGPAPRCSELSGHPRSHRVGSHRRPHDRDRLRQCLRVPRVVALGQDARQQAGALGVFLVVDGCAGQRLACCGRGLRGDARIVAGPGAVAQDLGEFGVFVGRVEPVFLALRHGVPGRRLGVGECLGLAVVFVPHPVGLGQVQQRTTACGKRVTDHLYDLVEQPGVVQVRAGPQQQ